MFIPKSVAAFLRVRSQLPAMVASLLLLVATTAQAGVTQGTITVDSIADNQPAGACTLRQAVHLINGSGDTGTCAASGTQSPPEIRFAVATPATIVLSSALVPQASVRIVGPGSALLSISGNASSRVFGNLSTSGATLHLAHLTLTQGRSPDGDAGGALSACCGHALDLEHLVISASTSSFAGGAVQSSVPTTIRDSVFTGNSVGNASGTFMAFGGALRFQSNQVLFERVLIEGNVAGSTAVGSLPGLGGAIATNESAQVTLIDSTLINNSALANVQRPGFNPNPAGLGGTGGAIFASGTVTLLRSTVSDNTASFQGGGIYNIGTTRVINSTLAHNSVPGASSPSEGGGIFNAAANGFGAQVVLNLIQATLYGNSAASGGGLHNRRADAAQVQIDNSAFGHNGSGQPGGDIVNAGSGALSGRHSLVESGAGGLVDGVDGNIVGVSAQFFGLADNGGLTDTVRFAETSPLRNGGDNDLALDADGAALITDQRNLSFVPRIHAGTVDIGAIEETGIVFANGFESD